MVVGEFPGWGELCGCWLGWFEGTHIDVFVEGLQSLLLDQSPVRKDVTLDWDPTLL